jgi:hypothetical protein
MVEAAADYVNGDHCISDPWFARSVKAFLLR